MKNILVEIFVEIDDFCKMYHEEIIKELKKKYKKNIDMEHKMTISEIATIAILFHLANKTTFKNYYIDYVLNELTSEFKKLLSYQRFVNLKNKYLFIVSYLLKLKMNKNISDIYNIDSFCLKSCHKKREKQHKTLKMISGKGKTSVDWFFGLKLHLVTNSSKQLVNCIISSGNIADNNENIIKTLTKNISGKFIGDRGYILNSELKDILLLNNIIFITRKRKNMKNNEISPEDEILLKKRWSIETVGGLLKSKLSLEHSRHRSICGFFSHIISCLLSYFYYSNNASNKAFI